MERWRSKRIGIDLDGPSRFTLMRTIFNAKHYFPGAKIDVKETKHGFHIRIWVQHTLAQNFRVRRSLGDDPMRLFFDENRLDAGLISWIDTLFEGKKTSWSDEKMFIEQDYDVERLLMMPFCSKLPCRKGTLR